MRLLIVDDHPMTCAGLKSLLQVAYPDAHIETRHDAAALRGEIRAADWDFIFLDMHLPGVRFAELMKEIVPLLSQVILISANPEPELVEQAKARGVRGLLLKNADAAQILDGFRRIGEGEKVFADTRELVSVGASMSELTERQQEVYVALLGGLSNKQIARKLGISEYTVKEHVTAVLARFGARNRLDLLLQKQRSPVI